MKKIFKRLQHVAENIWDEVTDYFDAFTGHGVFTDWRVALTYIIFIGIIMNTILVCAYFYFFG
jgi:hypothetical protein